MRIRRKLFLTIAVIFPLLFCSQAFSQGKFNLLPGATGKKCLNCHVSFQEKLKNRFVHTPVKKRECTGCHSPHTSAHGKLLEAEPEKICVKCHTKVVPQEPVSSHAVISEGGCVKCHDPHASGNKNNLLKKGSGVCFECHKELGDKIAALKFKHSPVEKNCANCHNPHGSGSSEHLLKKDVPGLCLSCHKTGGASFKKKHMNYPMNKANCISCHNPHGSNQKGILFAFAHKPFESRMCNQCHQGTRSATPLATKKEGYDLCKGCHKTAVDSMFTKNRVHWPLLDKTGCLNCHNPHVSAEAKLLRGNMVDVCGECHTDTAEKVRKAQSKHPPVDEGNCTACHSPHSSDQVSLRREPEIIPMCSKCHDWQTHKSHPLGKEFSDPRNRNLDLQCLSCHRPHGTEFKNLMSAEDISVVCTRCHKQYKR